MQGWVRTGNFVKKCENHCTLFHSQKYVKNCGIEVLKLRSSEKIANAELLGCGCGATFL
jgi:hypothetical protein